tara:strand:+ start:446 stop:1465 length:1020 start_codon:yes stop_codon:yes gene_type:complete
MYDAKLPSRTDGVPHGGNVDWATAVFGEPPQGWLDLSTGINPHAYAFSEIKDSWWHRLPTASDIRELCRAAAQYYGVPDANCVVAVPGSQTAIQWLPRLRGRTKVAIVSPTYGEHRHVWQSAGHDVVDVPTLEKVRDDVSVVIVTNPNNPDGRLLFRDQLDELRERLAARGGLLVVDEAFADVVLEVSISAMCGREGLVVLRSFGKFFGLAGLRLGFVLAPVSVAADLLRSLGPWAVSGPALVIATEAFADTGWHADMRQRLASDAVKLDCLLKAAKIEIVGGTSLFRLGRVADATLIAETLGRSGILVRRFDDRPDWLRFGLPRSDDQWERLARAIAG